MKPVDIDEPESINSEILPDFTHYSTFLLYARSEKACDRQAAVRDLTKLLRSLSLRKEKGQIDALISLIESVFIKETDSELRCLLIDQIPLLYIELMAIDHFILRANRIFPEFITASLGHSSEDVRTAAFSVIEVLVEQRFLSQEILQNVICPTLFSRCESRPLNENFVNDEQRVEAVTLLCKIITYPGAVSKRWIFENFFGRYSLMLQDSAFHVRKASVAVLGKLASMFGQTFTEQIAMPFLLLLSKDEVWGVRKSCCEAFVDVARNCDMEIRRRKLAPQFITFLSDQSRWVSQIALQKLGPFIATFADETRLGKEIKDGRLIVANSDINYASSGMRKRTGSDVEEWDALFERQMPPGLLFPEVFQDLEQSLKQADKTVMNEITHLLNNWVLNDDGIASRSVASTMKHLTAESGVAASCSTHLDLTKQILDDVITLPYVDAVNSNGQECEMDVSTCEVILDVGYWSQGFCEINPTTYHANQKEITRKKLIADFIRRRVDSLYPVVNEIRQSNMSISEQSLCRSDSDDAVMEVDESDDEISAAPQVLDDQKVVPQALLDTYVHMATSEGEINRHCAHSFPAVAFTLGRNNWPCIRNTYVQLASDMQWRVRHSLAASMHEIAAIIGEENADAHLVPIFEQFTKDVEDVKFGLLKHLYDFLKLLTLETRRKLLKILPTFLHSDSDNERNWRYRLEYVRQCILLCQLYDMQDINEYLAAIALTVANDRVAEVRKEATSLLACVLGRFVREEWAASSHNTDGSPIPITESFVSDIVRGFAHSKSWQRRQIFSFFCEKVLSGEFISYEQFSSLLLDDLMKLKNDAVPNVRIAFARALSTTRGGRGFHGQRDFSTVRHGLEELLCDNDVDCRRTARQSLGIQETENFIDVRNRGERIREKEDNMLGSYYIERMDVEENE